MHAEKGAHRWWRRGRTFILKRAGGSRFPVCVCACVQPPLRRLRCAARQLHTLSRRPVSVWQKTSLVVGPRAQNVCGGGGNGCQGEWGRQQMNRREATRRWEAQKKVTSLRGFFHPPLPRPLSRRPLSCQRWVTWLLGLQVRARARVCVCAVVRNVVGFLDGSCAFSPHSHGTISCQWPVAQLPPFMSPPLQIEVNINEVALGFRWGLHKWRCKTYIIYTYQDAGLFVSWC